MLAWYMVYQHKFAMMLEKELVPTYDTVYEFNTIAGGYIFFS